MLIVDLGFLFGRITNPLPVLLVFCWSCQKYSVENHAASYITLYKKKYREKNAPPSP